MSVDKPVLEYKDIKDPEQWEKLADHQQADTHRFEAERIIKIVKAYDTHIQQYKPPKEVKDKVKAVVDDLAKRLS